jgi:hypothetical protein
MNRRNCLKKTIAAGVGFCTASLFLMSFEDKGPPPIHVLSEETEQLKQQKEFIQNGLQDLLDTGLHFSRKLQ